jgi:hypothetical protein
VLCSDPSVYPAEFLFVSAHFVSGCFLVFVLHWLVPGVLELREELLGHFAVMEVVVSLALRVASVQYRVSEEVVSFCFLVSAPRLQPVETEC